MGLKAAIGKDYNFLYLDFEDAYWYISGIGITVQGGVYGVSYALTAYPSRDSKNKTVERTEVGQLSIGGSEHYLYSSTLYEFIDFAPYEYVFTDEVAPTSLDELKTATYNYIKATYPEMNFTDVFEEGQVAEEEE